MYSLENFSFLLHIHTQLADFYSSQSLTRDYSTSDALCTDAYVQLRVAVLRFDANLPATLPRRDVETLTVCTVHCTLLSGTTVRRECYSLSSPCYCTVEYSKVYSSTSSPCYCCKPIRPHQSSPHATSRTKENFTVLYSTVYSL